MQAMGSRLLFEVDERENGPADLSDPQAQWPKVLPAQTAYDVQLAFANFIRNARRVAAANLVGRICCNSPVIPKQKYKGLMSLPRGKLPSFNRKFFLEELRKYNSRKQARATTLGVATVDNRHVFGHLLAFLLSPGM